MDPDSQDHETSPSLEGDAFPIPRGRTRQLSGGISVQRAKWQPRRVFVYTNPS